MIRNEEVFKIGHFTKPHGIKGEIGLVTAYDIFSHAGDPFLICEIEGILVPFFIEEYRSKTETVLLVKLETVDSEEAAREFSNCEVYYPLQALKEEDRSVASTGWAAYTGYTISDEAHGLLGEIRAIDESTANTLLQIDCREKELLVPAVEGWIRSVDHGKKQLTISVPEGLLDL
ncbi:MAG: ribosome maturation factor RimM [Tannerellaceae bacterium]|jgi:16S rRNA processing protein RimM|nr:ribosome maturation factor RimM [Tannerellaceae bacterium]